MLRNELAAFGVRVMYVAPGFIRTNIYNNAAASTAIFCSPQGPYAPGMEYMHRDPFKHDFSKALPVEDFAARLAAVVASPRPPAYWRAGHLSWGAPIIAWLLPVWAGDWVAWRMFHLQKLADAAGAWRERVQQEQRQQQQQGQARK